MDGITLSKLSPIGEIVARDYNPAVLYIMRLDSDASKRTMCSALNKVAKLIGYEDVDGTGWATFDWSLLTYGHMIAIRNLLMQSTTKAATINIALAALRGVLKEAWRLGYMPHEEYARCTSVPLVAKSGKLAGREITKGELTQMLDYCSRNGVLGQRDAACIALMYGCAMRREEVPALRMKDYNPETGQVNIIAAKRNKDRTVFITGNAKAALDDWLKLRGNADGYVIVRLYRSKDVDVGHYGDYETMLTDQAIYKRVIHIQEVCGLEKLAPHDFRRTAVGDMLDAGVDISTAADVVGHANAETTRGYDRRGQARVKRASETLSLPYRHKRKATNDG